MNAFAKLNTDLLSKSRTRGKVLDNVQPEVPHRYNFPALRMNSSKVWEVMEGSGSKDAKNYVPKQPCHGLRYLS